MLMLYVSLLSLELVSQEAGAEQTENTNRRGSTANGSDDNDIVELAQSKS